MAEREWFDTDYYQVLGVTSSATDKEITRAYRQLAKENHPDTNPGKEETFKKISAAYDVLGDAEKRKEYDEVRRMGPAAAGFGGGGFPGGPGGFNTGDFGDLGDIFSGLFGGASSTCPAGSRSRDQFALVVSRRGDGRRDAGSPPEREGLRDLSRHRRGSRHLRHHL